MIIGGSKDNMAEKQVKVEVLAETDLSQVEDLESTIKDTKTEAESLQQAFQEATAEVERLEDALDEAYLNGDDIEADIISDELAEAQQAAEELQAALEGLSETDTSQVKDDVQGIGDEAETSTESVNELGNSLNLLESAALLGVAEQIGQIGDQAEGMAQEMNTAAITVGQLATQTGVAEPKMVSLINYISNATFPQEEAMAYVQALNQMGVSADKLGDSATNMDKINDATGIGYQKVMQLTQGLRAVGVSADNLPSTFNAIAYAQSNVNGGADTLNMVLKRQASTINEYGLNVDQLVIIMQKLSEQGVQGMKMGSALSDVLKETNGDTQALERSLGLQAGTLSNASDVTGQYTGKLEALAQEEADHKTPLDKLGAAWEDLSLAMSPVFTQMASIFGLIGEAGQFAVGINGLMKLAETFGIIEIAEGSLIPVQIAEGAAGWFSIGWIALAVVLGLALGAALIYLYNNSETFRNAVDGLANAISNGLAMAWQGLMNMAQGFMDMFGAIADYIGISGDDIIGSIWNVITFMLTLPLQLGIIFTNILAKVLGFKGMFVQDMMAAALNSIQGFFGYFGQMYNKLVTELNNMLNAVKQWASQLWQRFKQAALDALNAFLGALGIHSPGIMQVSLIREITDTGKRIPNESRNLLYNIGVLGSDIVDEFGNPSLGLNYNTNGNFLNNAVASSNNNGNNALGGVTINMEIGSVDKEERVNEIVDAIIHRLTFENATAGRTV